MSKTLFGDILSQIQKTLGLSDVDIAKKSYIGKATIHSMKYREKVNGEKINDLVRAIIELTAPEAREQFCGNISFLNQKFRAIWEKHGVGSQYNEFCATDTFDDIIKTLFTVAYSSGGAENAATTDSPKRRLVAFDLDGTLIKGIRHSWTVLWQAIGKTSEDATRHKKDFEEGRLSYAEWCRSDLEALRAGGLTMAKVIDAAKKSGCSLTKNLREAIDMLHNNNCKVVIISGGADCLLYALLPDADEIFDDIYINRCKFGADGILEDIVPTEYDWDADCLGVQGKEAGFRFLCAKYDAKELDSVFVGDDRNDFRAMGLAGMKIFYHSFSEHDATRGTTKGAVERDWPRNIIIESRNDLKAVVNRILDWDFSD